jgi:signal transduction histidine kinase
MVGATADDLARIVAIRAGACLAIAGAAFVVAAERVAIGRNLAQIARLLAGERGRPTAEALLRDAVGDPSLVVGYWTDERGYVGADGRPVDLSGSGGQRTELTSRGRPIAVLIHDAHALPADLLDARIGPEARLAIQNESLELELERHLDQLRASRRRVVDAGDAERRRLERDLHDGAQQLLLALSFEIRRGERSATERDDEVSATLFADLRAVTERILEQLRVLAHGIHPTILTNAGLAPALATFGSALDSPPSLSVEVPHRLKPATEAAVYALVTDLVAARPDRASMSWTITEEGETIRIRVDRDLHVPRHVLDRLSAAGGRYVAGEAGPEFVLPCA